MLGEVRLGSRVFGFLAAWFGGGRALGQACSGLEVVGVAGCRRVLQGAGWRQGSGLIATISFHLGQKSTYFGLLQVTRSKMPPKWSSTTPLPPPAGHPRPSAGPNTSHRSQPPPRSEHGGLFGPREATALSFFHLGHKFDLFCLLLPDIPQVVVDLPPPASCWPPLTLCWPQHLPQGSDPAQERVCWPPWSSVARTHEFFVSWKYFHLDQNRSFLASCRLRAPRYTPSGRVPPPSCLLLATLDPLLAPTTNPDKPYPTPNPKPYTLNPKILNPKILNPKTLNPNSKPYTLNPTPYTLHLTPRAWALHAPKSSEGAGLTFVSHRVALLDNEKLPGNSSFLLLFFSLLFFLSLSSHSSAAAGDGGRRE